MAAGIWILTRTVLPPGGGPGRTAGVIAALLLASAPSVWSQATINEVYGLQFFLFALFFSVWSRPSGGRLPLLAYLAGLAFANHQSAIFLAPFLVERIWPRRRRRQTWFATAGFACLGLTLYLFLPIRSAQGPLLDWGGTARATALWRHITGWQYSGWVGPAGLAQFRRSLSELGAWIWANFPWLLLPLAVAGLVLAWRRRRPFFWSTVAAALLCAAFGLNFPNPDVEAFYLLLFVILALWSGAGAMWLWSRGGAFRLAVPAALLLSLALPAPARYAAQNQRNFRVPDDWVRDALETVAPGSVILTREWDHYSPWLYLRFVTGLRPDVMWIDTELLRRSWYPDFIRRADPERYARARPALERLAPQIALFEAGRPYDPARIEAAYADAIYALSLGQPGPVYADGVAGTPQNWGIERGYLRGAREVPWGLLTRLFRPDDTIPALPPWPAYRNAGQPPTASSRTNFHLGLYDRARSARAALGR